MQPGRSILVASIAILAGCNSDSTTPVSLVGQLGFAYTGALSGNFSANGEMPLTTTAQRATPWAAGQRDAAVVFVDASMPRSASTFDAVFMSVDRTTAGTSTVVAGEASIVLLLGASNSGTGQALQLCAANAGSITIAEITATRARGSFTGTGQCLDPVGTSTSFGITNGTFDVALLVEIP